MKGSATRLGTAVHNLGLRSLHKRGGGGVAKSNSAVRAGVTWLGQLMGWNVSDSALCMANCSGHGECNNGTCFCEVRLLFHIMSR